MDDEILNVTLADAAAREKELTEGRCELPTLHEGTTVAVTMIDMLDVEAVVMRILDTQKDRAKAETYESY